MPTTCGFPNCKFRSRYRGQEDNRHFYRIPKRPLVLRQRWLRAIGRTEETVVSQLRICSAHFKDGEKREGDIPVPDPEHDTPISIQLPPKENKTLEKRRQKCQIETNKCLNMTTTPFSSLNQLYERLGLGDPNQVAVAFANALKCASEQNSFDPGTVSRPSSHDSPLFNSATGFVTTNGDRNSGFGDSDASPLAQFLLHPLHATDNLQQPSGPADNVAPLLSLCSNQFGMKPLVALLDGRDCAIEMALLKDIATVAFCDAQNPSEIHQRVLNEAVVALAYNSLQLDKDDLKKFKRLKTIIRIGPSTGNIDLETASALGIAVCTTPTQCIEEQADTTLSFILDLYRKTHILSRAPKGHGVEGLKEMAAGTKRPGNSTILVIGLGNVGKAVAVRAKAFGFKVAFYDPKQSDGIEKALGIYRYASLDEALANADCVTFHCPVNAQTKNMINMQNLKRMKKGVYIVNIISEHLFVESDLIACLRSGHVGAAAFDVNVKNDALTTFPNVICTPRMSWYSDQSCKELREAAALEARKVLKGDDPFKFSHCVNQRTAPAIPPNLPSTSVIANVASSPLPVPSIPPLTSNSFLGFPNCLVNTPMMMWPTGFPSDKPVFSNVVNENGRDESKSDLKCPPNTSLVLDSKPQNENSSGSPSKKEYDAKSEKAEHEYDDENTSRQKELKIDQERDGSPLAKMSKLEETV
ncbi:unnamed protein product [Bursaphelenchus okinawaensis]|uniref:THAP-type domain-containing protein n=1 Tax=Bursaphelenchus okinawaensis TaxID=465554 RepID=A0A811KJE3_9BILA|nr:unnamed protein product [Bursaphelenchus okinawaensis]CAG9104136.1 unnamed protein product [Bursaphelenchus okinawaensis]